MEIGQAAPSRFTRERGPALGARVKDVGGRHLGRRVVVSVGGLWFAAAALVGVASGEVDWKTSPMPTLVNAAWQTARNGTWDAAALAWDGISDTWENEAKKTEPGKKVDEVIKGTQEVLSGDSPSGESTSSVENDQLRVRTEAETYAVCNIVPGKDPAVLDQPAQDFLDNEQWQLEVDMDARTHGPFASDVLAGAKDAGVTPVKGTCHEEE